MWGSGSRKTHTHLQYAILKNQLGLRTINCSMLHLVVCPRGSGCGFVVVTVLCPYFSLFFLFHFISISLQSVDGQVTVDCTNMVGGALQGLCEKQDSTCLDTWGATSWLQLCLWTTFVSQTDICLLCFCKSCRLVPLYSEVQCNKLKTCTGLITISSIYSFNIFQCIPEEREASQSHLSSLPD